MPTQIYSKEQVRGPNKIRRPVLLLAFGDDGEESVRKRALQLERLGDRR